MKKSHNPSNSMPILINLPKIDSTIRNSEKCDTSLFNMTVINLFIIIEKNKYIMNERK